MASYSQQNDEHKINLDELFKHLDSSPQGLSSEEALRRQQEYGLNVLEEKEKQSLVIWFGKHLLNFFALLLWTGAVLAFLSEYHAPGEGNLYIGIALACVVILNAIFTFIQEYQSEQIMESFRKMMPSKINVVRDGRRQEVLTHPLSLFELSLSIPFALWIFFGDEIRKLLIRKDVKIIERYFSW